MACRSGCPTQDHASWGECAREANLRVAYCGVGGGDATKQKKWDNDLNAYYSARSEGIQPAGTARSQVEAGSAKRHVAVVWHIVRRRLVWRRVGARPHRHAAALDAEVGGIWNRL